MSTGGKVFGFQNGNYSEGKKVQKTPPRERKEKILKKFRQGGEVAKGVQRKA